MNAGHRVLVLSQPEGRTTVILGVRIWKWLRQLVPAHFIQTTWKPEQLESEEPELLAAAALVTKMSALKPAMSDSP